MALYTETNIELDRELAAKALQGDQDAFAELIHEHENALFNLTYRMLGDAAEAEDAAQEAFIRAYYHLGQYDPARAFRTWLLSIGAHLCIDLMRKRRIRWLALDETLPPQYDAVGSEHLLDDDALSRERGEMVQGLLNRLRPDDRAIIALRYWGDLSYEEIAESLRVTTAVVKSRLFRARQAMASQMTLAGATAWLVAS
jgi:RNA polymerase sigma-70 factor (ECF subfamily)